MPCSYIDYCNNQGFFVTDLSSNKDSFNKVLPNATMGIVSVELVLKAELGAAHQIFIVEFRNELKAGYHTPARKIYDY